MKILVSACLLGLKCRYNGTEKADEEVLKLLEKHILVPFCPEIYGGLATPRDPAEIRDDRVVTEAGKDVTAEYEKGAQEALKLAQMMGCDIALLQDRSPSCGAGKVHNGLFDGGLVDGDGVTAALFRKNGIKVLPASRASEL